MSSFHELIEKYLRSRLYREHERARIKKLYDKNKGIIWKCECCCVEIQLNSKRAHLKSKLHQSQTT